MRPAAHDPDDPGAHGAADRYADDRQLLREHSRCRKHAGGRELLDPDHPPMSGSTLTNHVLVMALGLAGLSAACGDNNSSTATSPSTQTGPKTESWSSVLAPAGASSRSFTVTAAGTINVTMTDAGGRVI